MKVDMKLTETGDVVLYEPFTDWEIICSKDNKFYVYEWNGGSGESLYRVVNNLIDAYEAVSELM